MGDIKQELIKLGNTNPELREHIEPVLNVLTQKNATSTNDMETAVTILSDSRLILDSIDF
jgi:hypothetical protein